MCGIDGTEAFDFESTAGVGSAASFDEDELLDEESKSDPLKEDFFDDSAGESGANKFSLLVLLPCSPLCSDKGAALDDTSETTKSRFSTNGAE